MQPTRTHQRCLWQVLYWQTAGAASSPSGFAHLLHRPGVVLPDVPERLWCSRTGWPSASTGGCRSHVGDGRADTK